MVYLLDTNACIQLLNNSSPSLAVCVHERRPEEIAVCSIVKAELLYRARKSARPAENLRLLERFFQPLASLPFDDASAHEYGVIRSELEDRGRPIGPNDLIIAAIARANGYTLVTHNTREFSRVVGLRFEDWE